MSNHGRVLAYISVNPDVRLRDVSERVGITERRTAQIVSDLEQAGYLTRTRVGRRNRYQIDPKRKIQTPRLPMTVGQLLALLAAALDQSPLA
jgi:DNA-binding MarR family transcriptional regulator